MRERIIHETISRKKLRYPDGVLVKLPVDQFPVKECNISRYGFPKSDVTMFDEMQRSTNVDMSLYAAFAARLGKIIAERPNGINLWLDDAKTKINPEAISKFTQMYRPAWMQTQAEEKQYINWFCEQYDMPLFRQKLEEQQKYEDEQETPPETPPAE